MSTIQGCVIVNGLARNGITVNLYAEGSFTGTPSGGTAGMGGTALPTGGILQTTTTGPGHGGDGSYRFTVAASGAWYAGTNFNGFYTWDYHTLPGDGSIAVNVKNYGAIGAGTNVDDTAAFNLAIAAVTGQGGGDVYVPPGKYAINLTLKDNNVRLLGTSMTLNGTPTNCLVPYNTGSPVITVGDDAVGGSNRRSDIRIEHLTLEGGGPNGTGLVGLCVTGGAQRLTILKLGVHNFTQNCVLVQGGTNNPAQLTWFDHCQFQPNNTCTDAGVAVVYPVSGSQWTTDIYFDNCQWVGPSTSGYQLRIDSAQIYASNCFFNINNGHGIKFEKNSAIGPSPRLDCTNVGVDSGTSTDVGVETYNTSYLIPLFGTAVLSCKGKLSDGTTFTLDSGAARLADKTRIILPFCVSTLAFGTSSGDTALYNTAFNINISPNPSPTQMTIASSGNIRLNTSGGSVDPTALGSVTCQGILDVRNSIRLGNASGTAQMKMWAGTGSPEGVSQNAGTAQPSGSVYYRTDGDAGRIVYTKISGNGSSGWRPITEHIPTTVYTSASITGAVDDQVICCSGTTAVRLPAAPSLGRVITIKDSKGNAGSANITISPAAGTIDGASTLVIAGNYGKATLVYNGTEWGTI